MHCELQTNALDDDCHNHSYVHDHAYHDNVDDGDVQYDRCRLDDGGDTNSSDPSTNDALCSDMDATSLANNPNNKANASTPNLAPKTNHISMDDRYRQVL